MSHPSCNFESASLFLAIDSIGISKDSRKSAKKKVQELADSMKVDGLLQSIGVRKDPENSERYLLVFGRHRLEAAQILGWSGIEAKLLDLDEHSAESATLAENLFRNPLKQPDYLAALKRWNDAYNAKFPETTEHRAGGKARARQRQAETSRKIAEPVEPLSVPTFTQHAAEVLGVSPVKIRRDVRIARAIGEEGLGILTEASVPPPVIQKIADLKNPDHRQKAVELIGSGTEPLTALALATVPGNATLATVEQEDEPSYIPEEQMDDEEWLLSRCSDALKRLTFQAVFRREAILWRRTQEIRADLRSRTKKFLNRERSERRGPLQFQISKIFDIPHPNDWASCGHCGGNGCLKDESPCPTCYGSAYSLKSMRS
jgi:ParB family chromosome partitioning protein